MKFYLIQFKFFKNNIFASLSDLNGKIILLRTIKSNILYKETKRFSFYKFSFKVLNNFVLNFINDVSKYDELGYYIIFIYSSKKIFLMNIRYNFLKKSFLKIYKICFLKFSKIHGYMRSKKLRRK